MKGLDMTEQRTLHFKHDMSHLHLFAIMHSFQRAGGLINSHLALICAPDRNTFIKGCD